MTHVQTEWTAKEALHRGHVQEEDLKTIRTWVEQQPRLPRYITDEQLVLFLHSCYSNVENTQKCIDEYYKLRMRVPQFFQKRDVDSPCLKKALSVLHYGIFPVKTPKGHQIVFHRLNNTDPAHYVFNDGFKLLVMMMDAVYAMEGPLQGLIIAFDMKGVKLGHITKLPLTSVRRCLEYIQEANPVRLKGIHVLNVHPLIDKIMMLVRPFLRKQFLSLLHFHKEGDEALYEALPKECLPKEYGGELENVPTHHERFLKEINGLRPLFLKEDELMFSGEAIQKNNNADANVDLSRLEID